MRSANFRNLFCPNCSSLQLKNIHPGNENKPTHENRESRAIPLFFKQDFFFVVYVAAGLGADVDAGQGGGDRGHGLQSAKQLTESNGSLSSRQRRREISCTHDHTATLNSPSIFLPASINGIDADSAGPAIIFGLAAGGSRRLSDNGPGRR